MPIDATVGGVSSNSYVEEAYANSYLSERLDASEYVDEENSVKRQQALITATRYLDQRVVWVGDRATTDQSLEWPRVDREGESIEAGIIPVKIRQATCELALYLLKNGDPIGTTSLDAMRVGSISIDFNEKVDRVMLPEHVTAMISNYGRGRVPNQVVRAVPLWR